MITGPQCCNGGVCGYGDPSYGVVGVGIAPGRNEATVTHRPLTGEAGKLFDALLIACRWHRDKVYCTNLICWWKDEPDDYEMDVCQPRLTLELQSLKPKVIIAMGKLASERLTGLPFAKTRGAVIKTAIDGQYILSTNHPAAALHPDPIHPQQQIDAAYNLVRDLKKLPLILDGYYDMWQEPDYILLDDLERAQAVVNSLVTLPSNTPVAMDIETNYDKDAEKYSPFDHEVLSLAFSFLPNTSYVIPSKVLPSISWPQGPRYSWWHGQFDTIELRRRFGYWLPIVEDGMLGSYSLDERKGHHALKPSSREWTGADFYEETEHKIEGPELYKYNGLDTAHTYRHIDRQKPLQIEEGVRSYYEDILIPAANMLAESQYHGIKLDVDMAHHVKRKLGIDIVLQDQDIQEYAAEQGYEGELNPGSPQQIAYLLYDVMGMVPNPKIMRHIKNKRSTDKNILRDLNHPLCEMILRRRQLLKDGSTYILGPLNQVKYDGRVHSVPHLHGTVTGRLTYEKPTLNTLPKGKEDPTRSEVRRIFTATDSDHIIIEADYAQIEARLAAWASQDPNMLEDIFGGDWHSNTAKAMFNATPDSPQWRHLRDAAKHVNFGSMYWEGANGLTRLPPIGLGCDIATARDYLAKWNARYSVFVQWRLEQVRKAYEVGYVQDPWGQKRRFPIRVNEHQDRQIGNAWIQMTANKYTLTSCIELREPLKQLDTTLLFIEHDAGYWEAPRSNLSQVLTLIKEVMEKPRLGMPGIAVEMIAGPNLHDMESIA